MMDMKFEWVGGHVEVYDEQGNFCFSADTMREAQNDLMEMISAA